MLEPAGSHFARCRACGFIVPAPVAGTRPATTGASGAFGSLLPGTVLRGRYELLRELRAGSHGVTFLAHHQFLNLPCVVKVLPGFATEAMDDAARRLRAEAAAGYRVNHPNVVRVQDADIADGLCYFVMEHVDGADLRAALDAGLRFDWRQVVHFTIEIAQGLAAIHRAGLVHRDIKPANLILGTDGHVRIADLGVAGFVDGCPHGPHSAADSPATAWPGMRDRAGSLAYAAPEVLAGTGKIGPQADLYSLGATLFELVTGALPRGSSVYRTFLDSDRTPVAWPRDAPADVPGWFISAILCLLEPTPEKRFESPEALIEYLEHPTQVRVAGSARARRDRLEPRGLVVLPFENLSQADDEAWLGQALADHLARALARLPGAYVVDLEQFLTTLRRLDQRSGRARGEQLLEAGRLSGAATVIEGRFRREGENIELGVRLLQSAQAGPLTLPPVHGTLGKLAELEIELFHGVTAALQLATEDLRPAPGGRRPPPAAEERFFTARRAFLRGDYQSALELGRRAVELDPQYGEAVGFLGVCCARMGRYEQALEYNRQQQLLADRAGDERLKVEALANLGAMHYFRGEYAAASECLTAAAQAAEKLGLATELAVIRNNLGFAALQLGRQADAEAAYQQAIATHKRYGALVALVGPYSGMGHVLREQGRYEEARRYFRRVLALAQESDDYVNMGLACMNLGHCAVLQGRLADAKHELAVALNILEQTSFWNGLARVYERMADLNLRLGNCPEALRCADRRIELARRHSNRRMELAAWRQKAEALRRAGRDAEAEACLAQAEQEQAAGSAAAGARSEA